MEFKKRIYLTSCEGLTFLEGNRCATEEIEYCTSRDYTERMIRAFKNRRRNSEKLLKANGWYECCPVILFAWHQDQETLYLSDGQGRSAAAELINNQIIKEHPDMTTDELNRNNMLIRFPADIYIFDNPTLEEAKKEMLEVIINMNSKQKPWTKDEQIEALIINENNEHPEFKEGNDLCKEISKKMGVSMSVARDSCWGQGSCKRGRVNLSSNVWEDVSDFANLFVKLKTECANNGWSERDIKRLTTEKFITTFRDNYYKPSKKHSDTCFKQFKNEFLNKLPKLNDSERLVFSNSTAYIKNYLMKQIVNKRRTLKQMLNPTEC